MEVVIWLFSKNLTVQSGLNIVSTALVASIRQHVLWHMTHYKVSAAITVWKTVTKTQNIFFPTAGAIKHVEYTCKEVCTLCNRYLGVCYVLRHLSNCIPVACIYSSLGHFLVCESAGSGL